MLYGNLFKSFLSSKIGFAVAGGLGLMLTAQTQASVVSLPTTLNNLTPSGASATVGPLTFNTWGYTSSPSGVTAIASKNIGVAAVVQPNDDGVSFSTSWSATTSYEDSDITFHVHSSTPITAVDLHFNGVVTGSNVLAQVVETVMDSSQHTVAQLLVDADGHTSVLDDIVTLATPETDLYITKDISVSSLKSTTKLSSCEGVFCYNNSNWGNLCDDGHGGVATISNVENTFVTSGNTGSPVPEPASLGILGVGAIGLLLHRRKH